MVINLKQELPQRRYLFPIGHPDPEKTKKPLALFVYPVAPEDGTGAPYRFNKNRAIREIRLPC